MAFRPGVIQKKGRYRGPGSVVEAQFGFAPFPTANGDRVIALSPVELEHLGDRTVAVPLRSYKSSARPNTNANVTHGDSSKLSMYSSCRTVRVRSGADKTAHSAANTR